MPVRVAAILVVLLALPVGPLAAQGFLDALFGSDGPSRPAGSHDRFHATPGFSSYERPRRFDDLFSPAPFDVQPTPAHTAYRTLCVRMCDGYYFPISHATDSGGLAHDAQVCAAACGSEARLFYHANPGGAADSMVDLSGRAYASYPTAFKYRKALVEGCLCRPQPWTETELARHRSYAATQLLQPGGMPSGAAASRPVDPHNAVSDSQTASGDPPSRFGTAPRASLDWDWLSALGATLPARSRYRRP